MDHTRKQACVGLDSGLYRKFYPDISLATQTGIETYRSLVLNAFSHYNTERHEIKTELANAINAVKALKAELDAIR